MSGSRLGEEHINPFPAGMRRPQSTLQCILVEALERRRAVLHGKEVQAAGDDGLVRLLSSNQPGLQLWVITLKSALASL